MSSLSAQRKWRNNTPILSCFLYHIKNDWALQEVNLTLHKFDELDSLIHGIEYIEDNNMDRECYYFLNPRCEELCQKVTFDFSNPYPFLVRIGASC